MDVDVRVLRKVGSDAELDRARILTKRERRERGLLHDVAELAGDVTLPFPSGLRRLDEEDVAAGLGPGQARW